jgi:hypothetical protein
LGITIGFVAGKPARETKGEARSKVIENPRFCGGISGVRNIGRSAMATYNASLAKLGGIGTFAEGRLRTMEAMVLSEFNLVICRSRFRSSIWKKDSNTLTVPRAETTGPDRHEFFRKSSEKR